MATTTIILREKIENVGAEADLVQVRAGYARNFLIPKGLAYEATESNRQHIEALKVARAEREAKELEGANKIASDLKKLSVVLELEVGEGGKAFGAITNQDIHAKLVEAGFNIDRHAIELEKPIKAAGKYDVEVKVHPQVTATLKVRVDESAK